MTLFIPSSRMQHTLKIALPVTLWILSFQLMFIFSNSDAELTLPVQISPGRLHQLDTSQQSTVNCDSAPGEAYVSGLQVSVHSTKKHRKINSVLDSEADVEFRAASEVHQLRRVLDASDGRHNNRYDPPGDGEGTDIYLFDTGIAYDLEEFEGRAKFVGRDFVNPGGDGRDDHGHGTFTASLAVGRTVGIARKAIVYSVKVLNKFRNGDSGAMVQALEYVEERYLSNKSRRAIVLLPLVGQFHRHTNDIVERLIKNGIVVVTSAGNNADDACRYTPGSARGVINTGAVNEHQDIWQYSVRWSFTFFYKKGSNFGECVDIFAPGTNIYGASANPALNYIKLSGTSATAPQAAGVAAVLLQLFPTASPAKVKDMIVAYSKKNVLGLSKVPESYRNSTPNRLLAIPKDAIYRQLSEKRPATNSTSAVNPDTTPTRLTTATKADATPVSTVTITTGTPVTITTGTPVTITTGTPETAVTGNTPQTTTKRPTKATTSETVTDSTSTQHPSLSVTSSNPDEPTTPTRNSINTNPTQPPKQSGNITPETTEHPNEEETSPSPQSTATRVPNLSGQNSTLDLVNELLSTQLLQATRGQPTVVFPSVCAIQSAYKEMRERGYAITYIHPLESREGTCFLVIFTKSNTGGLYKGYFDLQYAELESKLKRGEIDLTRVSTLLGYSGPHYRQYLVIEGEIHKSELVMQGFQQEDYSRMHRWIQEEGYWRVNLLPTGGQMKSNRATDESTITAIYREYGSRNYVLYYRNIRDRHMKLHIQFMWKRGYSIEHISAYNLPSQAYSCFLVGFVRRRTPLSAGQNTILTLRNAGNMDGQLQSYMTQGSYPTTITPFTSYAKRKQRYLVVLRSQEETQQ